MFEVSGRVSHRLYCGCGQHSEEKRGLDAQNEKQIMAPLPFQERPGHRVGFFKQGLISGGLVVLTTLGGVCKAVFARG
jgi:hypothetical protein